ncbi:MAG: hypothetical protein JNJ77_08565 [Planctomycetia bacterium]|nr:hypothetical protein [Planctomycetia bacterium]
MIPALAPLLQLVENKIRQTQRRQGLQLAVSWLPLTLSLSLLLGLILAISLPLVGIQIEAWGMWIIAGSILVGLAVTCLLAWCKRPGHTAAALALDQACGLQERIVTVSTLKPEQHQLEAAQLLATQLQAHVNDVTVAERFPLRSNKRSWYAPLGALIALVLAVLFPVTGLFSRADAESAKDKLLNAKTIEQKPIDVTAFKQANEERKKRLKEIGSADLNELQKEIDQLLQKLEKTQQGSAEAKMSLEDVTRLTEKIRQQEGIKEKIDDIKKQLKLELSEKLANDKGPAEDFNKALAKADFDKARKEAAKLAEKLKNGQMSKEEMKELAKQMNNLKEKLDEIAQQKEKLEALEKSNLDPETKAREKAKIEQEMEKLKDLADLAQKMKEAAEELQKGDPEGAREAIEKMMQELQEMEMNESEMGELKLTEGDMEDLKNAIAGMKGKGGKSGGKKDQWDQKGDGEEKGQGGDGDGQGQGGDKRDDESEGGQRNETIDDTKSEDTNAKTQSTNKGKLTVVGDGPKQGKPGKDQVKERMVLSPAELDQAKQQASEALKQQKISQAQKSVVTDFYKNLAPGK